MIILVDEEDRENEGDLLIAADCVTPEAINFMARFGRGLVCLTLTNEHRARLNLPLMVKRNGTQYGTAFTLSIEAAQGVTTGISAADRAHTIRTAIQADARAEHLVQPGHVFPIAARDGGVLVRAGHTEAGCDLTALAGMTPAAVICEIMNDDGTMARFADLEIFARTHGLRILTIADLIRYRLQTERLVDRIDERPIRLDRTGTEWKAIVYDAPSDGRQFLALVKGEPKPDEPVFCRMHGGSLIGDLFSSSVFEGGQNLREAIDIIEREGKGVIVYLPAKSDLRGQLDALAVRSDPAKPPEPSNPTNEIPHRSALREFGLGAQILRELGLHKLRLLTNNPRKIAGIRGYGLEIVETVPLLEKKGR
jgi:3,4-dihydroxy 2-butanone 4-phosphate synthase/GTP cyclohydrolase II